MVSIWHFFDGFGCTSSRWWLKLLFFTEAEIFHRTLVLANFVFDMNASQRLLTRVTLVSQGEYVLLVVLLIRSWLGLLVLRFVFFLDIFKKLDLLSDII